MRSLPISFDVETKETKFTIVKKDKEWVLREAFKKDDKSWKRTASEDRLDPSKRDALCARLRRSLGQTLHHEQIAGGVRSGSAEFIVSATSQWRPHSAVDR